jgi:hypothetical protein
LDFFAAFFSSLLLDRSLGIVFAPAPDKPGKVKVLDLNNSFYTLSKISLGESVPSGRCNERFLEAQRHKGKVNVDLIFLQLTLCLCAFALLCL